MKKRADILLVERGLALSLEESRAFLMQGIVWSAQQRVDKPGTQLKIDAPLEIRNKKLEFISRAGDKLKHALSVFKVSPMDRVCLDVGCSTGGFTDCLLKNGARSVFALDVGYGLLDIHLRKNARVVVAEKTNARLVTRDQLIELSQTAKEISLIVSDVSFISLRSIVPNLREQFPEVREWILLFKPQFELSPNNLLSGGIVKSSADVMGAIDEFTNFMKTLGFVIKAGPETSPIEGKKSGNVEYLLFYETL
ncbi:MAG: TlyA family RNA methyltransferase [Deltaproteobacteria bacterium]|nr:TlyA family RNA methyltransferase [Deltaproteobacteria bacterium]